MPAVDSKTARDNPYNINRVTISLDQNLCENGVIVTIIDRETDRCVEIKLVFES